MYFLLRTLNALHIDFIYIFVLTIFVDIETKVVTKRICINIYMYNLLTLYSQYIFTGFSFSSVRSVGLVYKYIWFCPNEVLQVAEGR